VCESRSRCGIARRPAWNRSLEFAGKILIFPQTQKEVTQTFSYKLNYLFS